MKNNKNFNGLILLNNGRFVPIGFLNSVKSTVMEIIPGLSPKIPYTLKQLYGEKNWNELNSGEQKRAGWCMKHLVETRELPFRIVKARHEYPVHYQLKETF